MATNPCLCGFHGSTIRQCRCSPLQIENYLGKISGLLLDRIAIHVAVRPVDIDAWKSPSTSSMTSAAMECSRLRAKDVDFERREIIVRDGKGRKDRVTMLPDSLKEALRAHLARVKEQHVTTTMIYTHVLNKGRAWGQEPPGPVTSNATERFAC